MTDAKFTVVIPTYNRAQTIQQAVVSVEQQTFSRWKVLIIDDASTDETVNLLQPHLEDPRIQLIQQETNQGISHTLNRALQAVETPYFVQLDSDDFLAKDALQAFHKKSEKEPQAALLYGNICMWGQTKSGEWKCSRYIRHRPFHNKYQFLKYMTYMLHPRCYLTEALHHVGGWETSDPYDGRLMEDRRMVIKLIEEYPIRWIDQVLYHRRKHHKQLTNHAGRTARNNLRKRLVKDSLRKWGNDYRPVFGYRNGYLIVKEFVRRKKKKQAGESHE